MAKDLVRRTARAELNRLVFEGHKLGLTNLLPAPHDPARFNLWGDDLNTFLLVSHNIDGTLKVAGALPPGGTPGQALIKASLTDGDGVWQDAAQQGTSLPLANGVADPGDTGKWADAGHVHPDSGGLSALPGHLVAVPDTPAAGQVIIAGTGLPAFVAMSNAPGSGQVVVAYPFYLSNPLPPCQVGIQLNGVGSGADVLIGLAIYGSVTGSVGEKKPGGAPLFSGSCGSVAVAGSITTATSQHVQFTTAGTFTGAEGVLYWGVPYARAGATGAQAMGMQSTQPQIVNGNGITYFYSVTAGNAAAPDLGTGANPTNLNGSNYIPLVFRVV